MSKIYTQNGIEDLIKLFGANANYNDQVVELLNKTAVRKRLKERAHRVRPFFEWLGRLTK